MSKKDVSAGIEELVPEAKGGEVVGKRAPAAYCVPPWGAFRRFVEDNGNKYVRASYPNIGQGEVINTVWCGVPLVDDARARVMTPDGKWHDWHLITVDRT